MYIWISINVQDIYTRHRWIVVMYDVSLCRFVFDISECTIDRSRIWFSKGRKVLSVYDRYIDITIVAITWTIIIECRLIVLRYFGCEEKQGLNIYLLYIVILIYLIDHTFNQSMINYICNLRFSDFQSVCSIALLSLFQ